MYKGQEEKHELLNSNGKEKKKKAQSAYTQVILSSQTKAPCAVEIWTIFPTRFPSYRNSIQYRL